MEFLFERFELYAYTIQNVFVQLLVQRFLQALLVAEQQWNGQLAIGLREID